MKNVKIANVAHLTYDEDFGLLGDKLSPRAWTNFVNGIKGNLTRAAIQQHLREYDAEFKVLDTSMGRIKSYTVIFNDSEKLLMFHLKYQGN